MLHVGELLLDEARRAGIRVWTGRTGNLLWIPKWSSYFNEQLRIHKGAVKMALELEQFVTNEATDPSGR